METRDNKTIIRRHIEVVFNTGDVSKIHDFVSQEYTEVYEGVRHKIGIQGAINLMEPLLKAGVIQNT
jgi:hypothetical protein